MPEITYTVFRSTGAEFSLTIPDTYKLTFGPTVPGIGRGTFGRTAWSLRVYGPGKRLRAVYPDVTEFQSRDIQTEYIERDQSGIIVNRFPDNVSYNRRAQLNEPMLTGEVMHRGPRAQQSEFMQDIERLEDR